MIPFGEKRIVLPILLPSKIVRSWWYEGSCCWCLCQRLPRILEGIDAITFNIMKPLERARPWNELISRIEHYCSSPLLQLTVKALYFYKNGGSTENNQPFWKAFWWIHFVRTEWRKLFIFLLRILMKSSIYHFQSSSTDDGKSWQSKLWG